jgi:HAD superfamily hydrolase (TIGR01509 family)
VDLPERLASVDSGHRPQEHLMAAILFGSISTVADTSELQRAAFNDAFAQHGLDWSWDRDAYVAMLRHSGGRDRIAAYAESRGEEVDAAAIHATKSEIFQRRLLEDGVEPRPGVVETVTSAQQDGVKLGLVTTTSPDNVASLAAALKDRVDLGRFDVVVDSGRVGTPKPDQAAYTFALEQLGESAEDVVAIEDNLGGVTSARSAGVTVVAFPNANTSGHDFTAAHARVEALDFAALRHLTA